MARKKNRRGVPGLSTGILAGRVPLPVPLRHYRLLPRASDSFDTCKRWRRASPRCPQAAHNILR